MGEREQFRWWPSSFLSGTSDAFMAPVFAGTVEMARMVGVSEAARRLHDEAIGVGRASHLFRLPQTLEQDLHRTLSVFPPGTELVPAAAALEHLEALSAGEVAPKPGPLHVGSLARLMGGEDWIPVVASHHLAAFRGGIQSFPYFAH
jgi:hypothetical protein